MKNQYWQLLFLSYPAAVKIQIWKIELGEKKGMGIDIEFQFKDGNTICCHLCYRSWNNKFLKYLTHEEHGKCFQNILEGECQDKKLCLKLYTMLMVKGCFEQGVRTDDYPVKMIFY